MLPLEPVIALGAVILALVIFACLVLAGVQVVRCLRLPQDLPLLLEFEPPPPPVRPVGDPEGARSIARHQARVRALYRQALAVAQVAGMAQELSTALQGSPTSPERDLVLGACEQVRLAAAGAERARTTPIEEAEPLVAEHLRIAQSSWEEAQRCFARIPQPRNRRLWVLLAFAAVIAGWLGVLLAWRHAHEAVAGPFMP